MKILVVKRDKIGDLLLTTPMISHLRSSLPSAQIHLLGNNYNAWVLKGNADIDRLWVYRRVRVGRRVRIGAALGIVGLQWQLRRQNFDVAIVANGIEAPRAIWRATSTRAKRIIAYVGNASKFPGVNDPLRVDESEHEADRITRLLTPLGIAMPDKPVLPKFALPENSHRFAQQWLMERQLVPRGYLVLGLGARHRQRQPSTGQILEWTRHFKREWGLDTVFMWTPGSSGDPIYPGDDDIAQPVLQANAAQIHPFRGPIEPALGLIWNAATSIFPDSGLMHLAAASPGGVLGLFADTARQPAPARWAPRGVNAHYLEAPNAVPELANEVVYSRLERLLGAGTIRAREAATR